MDPKRPSILENCRVPKGLERVQISFLLQLPAPSSSISSFPYSHFYPPLPHPFATAPGLPQAGSWAGPGPRRGGLIGDHAGGTLRGPHVPNLRRATDRCGWVGKQPARGDRRLMRNCSDGAKSCPPLKGEVGENPHQLSKVPPSRRGQGDASWFV